MEIKGNVNLFEELRDLQLSKDSMKSINGGQIVLGIKQWSVCTGSGTLTEYYDAERDVYTWVNQHLGVVSPLELTKQDRTIC